MSWPTLIRYLHSLPGRLTLWYAGVFSLLFLAVFGAFYIMMRNHFHQWTDAELKREVAEVRIVYNEQGSDGVVEQLRRERTSEGERFLGRLLAPDGSLAFETAPGPWAKLPLNDALVRKARAGQEDAELVELDNSYTVRVLYSQLPDGSVLQIGLALLDHEKWMRRFSEDLLKVALLALMLSIGAGGFMAGRALAPVREIARTASAISGRSLGQRVPVSGRGDEVDLLAQSFNGMLERIDTLVEGLRDVTDSLAHDLRTPISGIRGMAELTLCSQSGHAACQETLYQIIDQMDRLLAQFNGILDVAEAESGTLALRLGIVPMEPLVGEMIQTFGPVAVDRGIQLEASLTPGLTVKGDRGRLGQVVANLLDNALKFTPTGGRIGVRLEPHPAGEVLLAVSDTGTGISQRDLPHIFERYYRGDKSRTGTGVGLGLPLVQGIVRAHGGRVTVQSPPENGTVFQVFLPSA